MPEKIQFVDVMDTFKRGVNNVLAQYRMMLKVTIVTTLIALVYGLLQPPSYKAVATFILEDKSGGKSGLGALASQIGFDIGSLTGGNAGMFEGDNILDIMQSRLIVEKVLLSKIDSTAKDGNITLADLYLTANKINKKWASDPALANFKFDATRPSQLQDSILYTIEQKIVKDNLVVSRQNKKGSIIGIQVISKDQRFSKLFAERLLKQTSDLYIDIKTSNLNNNITKLQNKADSLQAILGGLYGKTFQVAQQQLINTNTAVKINTVPEETTQRDKTVTYTLYGEVVKNLEALKLSQINQTPVIQVLDTPKFPLVNQATPLFLIVLMGVAVGLVLSILIAVYLYTDKIN
jgi:uncharacterized protein involved in exopolysaccharide biosynthesis